jgi:hypothetical protein
MEFLKKHPVGAVLIGVGIGMVFGSKIRALPVIGPAVAKVPSG